MKQPFINGWPWGSRKYTNGGWGWRMPKKQTADAVGLAVVGIGPLGVKNIEICDFLIFWLNEEHFPDGCFQK